MSIAVPDVAEALDFYTGVLGMTQRLDRPAELGAGAWLDVGGQQLHLIRSTTPDPRGQHFAVLVADLDATTAELRAAGVTVSDAVPIGAGRQAFLADPAGNSIELHEAAK
ncbi:MAG TPA: VOC family protein [Pseudonocardiaceae bacterium]|nr:VOC family protein [Pseudonocardiaceae bacterium]